MPKFWSISLLRLSASKTRYVHGHQIYRAQILLHFTLRLPVSEIQYVQGHQISEMHQMTPK